MSIPLHSFQEIVLIFFVNLTTIFVSINKTHLHNIVIFKILKSKITPMILQHL